MAFKIVFQPPFDVVNYDRRQSCAAQTHAFPQPFLDAIAVREAVFVHEQGVPLSMEVEPNDGACWHWIVYAAPDDASRDVTAATHLLPVATLRLVPYPHDPHPQPGSSWDPDPDVDAAGVIRAEEVVAPPRPRDRATGLHDGVEPYVKLGRLAVVASHRKHGLAGLLVRTALAWVREQRVGGLGWGVQGDAGEKWNGLVCVHAQEAVERAWAKWGFVRDEEMGRWFEAGIPHVGMFQRVKLGGDSTA